MDKQEYITKLENEYDLDKLDMFNSSLDAIYHILSFVLNKSIAELKLSKSLNIDKAATEKIAKILNKMCYENVPFQYITGTTNIYNEKYIVTPDVLIPRSDTECLIECAINLIKENAYESMLDLCTGSGVVGISVAKNSLIKHVDMSDISKKAIEVAKKNVALNLVESKCSLYESDIFSEIVHKNKKYDIITANPPYISKAEYETLSQYVKQEPYIALVAENNGLYMYEKIAREAKDYLTQNAALVFEIGYTQAEAVKQILLKNGYHDIIVIKDMNLNDRVVVCHFQNK